MKGFVRPERLLYSSEERVYFDVPDSLKVLYNLSSVLAPDFDSSSTISLSVISPKAEAVILSFPIVMEISTGFLYRGMFVLWIFSFLVESEIL